LSQQDPTSRNYTIAEAMYRASADGDAAAFFAPMSPDVVMREPGFLPYGGAHRGITALQALTAQVAAFVDLRSMVATSSSPKATGCWRSADFDSSTGPARSV
jgi:ketosteroid isomerase-like protein